MIFIIMAIPTSIGIFIAFSLPKDDLKNTVGEYMVNILAPIRDNISLSNELYELIKNSN